MRADIPILHDCIKPFRSTSRIAAVVGDTVFVHGGLVYPHLAAAMALKHERAKAAAVAAGSGGTSSVPTLPDYTPDEALAELNAQSEAWLSGAKGHRGRPPPHWLNSAHGSVSVCMYACARARACLSLSLSLYPFPTPFSFRCRALLLIRALLGDSNTHVHTQPHTHAHARQHAHAHTHVHAHAHTLDLAGIGFTRSRMNSTTRPPHPW